MSVVSRSLIGMLALAVTASVAHAQYLVPLHRHKAGVTGTLIRPTGEFQQFVDWGGGLGAYIVPGLTRDGTLGIRVDGNWQWYGHESYDVWVSPRVPDAWVRVSTDNMIFSLAVGPQVTLGTGPVRVYGFGTAGFSYFTTISSVDGGSEYAYDSETNFDDVSAALTAGGGLLTQLNSGHHPIWLDLSAQWTHNGVTDYLRSRSIIETPDGRLLVFPIRSEANYWTFRAGVAFGW